MGERDWRGGILVIIGEKKKKKKFERKSGTGVLRVHAGAIDLARGPVYLYEPKISTTKKGCKKTPGP